MEKKIKCKKHDQYYVNTGKGCSICKIENSKIKKTKTRNWTYTKWRDDGISSSNFDSFKLYIIKCWNDNEVFYKIGKTYTKLDKRFNSSIKLPYKYDVILTFSNTALYISNLEKRLHRENKKNTYLPLKDFTGKNECFSSIIQTEGFKKLMKNYIENH